MTMELHHRMAAFVDRPHVHRRQAVPSIVPGAAATTTSSSSSASTTPPPSVVSTGTSSSTTVSTTPAAAETTTPAVASSTSTSSSGLLDTVLGASSSSLTSSAAVTSSSVKTTASTTAKTTASTQATSAVVSTNSNGITTTLIVTGSATKGSSSASGSSTALSNSNSSSSDGPSVGTIVGIVAGVLVGVIVLATICGWLFRKKFGRKDEDEDSPFDRDDFRRQSMMLDDDHHNGGFSGGHSPQMSEHSMGRGDSYGNLGRQNTVGLPGLGRNGTLQSPRPPSSIVNHFQRPQQSFSPGQIVPNAYGQQPSPPRPVFNAAPSPYSGGSPGMDLYGGYPLAAGQQHQLDRGLYGMPPQGQHLQHPYSQHQTLDRSPSNASGYSQGPPVTDRRSPAPSHSPHDDRPLSLVHEEDDNQTYSRSGTPVDSNVQQSYFAHAHSESASSARGGPLGPLGPGPGPHRLSVGTNLPGYGDGGFGGFGGGFGPAVVEPQEVENPFARQRSLTADNFQDAKDSRAQRTLSVRNGNEDHYGRPVSAAPDDAYGGYQ